MKLSEAMMLGSVTCKMRFGDWNSCGLGSAANALEMPTSTTSDWDDLRISAMFAYWPWIAPSALDKYKGAPFGATYFGGDIAFRFDRDVISGKMTFEQLVDYVASIEPSCGGCNRFDCTCQPTAVIEPTCAELVTP